MLLIQGTAVVGRQAGAGNQAYVPQAVLSEAHRDDTYKRREDRVNVAKISLPGNGLTCTEPLQTSHCLHYYPTLFKVLVSEL